MTPEKIVLLLIAIAVIAISMMGLASFIEECFAKGREKEMMHSALSLTCPKCGAPPGESCTDTNFKNATHWERLRGF